MGHSEIVDNYTKVPNEIFIIVKILKPSSYIVLLHIIRQTIGYGKSSDGISISQFVNATGVSKSQIVESIKELKKLKVIKVTGQTLKGRKGKSFNLYRIDFKVITTLVQNLDKGSPEFGQGVVQNLDKGSPEFGHTKENTTKDNRTKEEREKPFLILTDEYIEKYTSQYIRSLTEANENLRNKKAYEIALRKKINAKNKIQMEDFDRWLLKLLADKYSTTYKGHNVSYKGKSYSIDEILPYYEFDDVISGCMYVVCIADEEGVGWRLGMKDTESLNHLIRNKALEEP